MKYIMLLNDGETFTNLEGCAIVAVPDDADNEAIEAQLTTRDGYDFVAYFRDMQDDGIMMVHNRRAPIIHHCLAEP